MLMTRKQVVLAGLIFFAAVAAFLIERLHVSEEEKIHGVVEGICSGLESSDVEAVLQHISIHYRNRSLSREGLRSFAEGSLQRYAPVQVRVTAQLIEPERSLPYPLSSSQAGGGRGFSPLGVGTGGSKRNWRKMECGQDIASENGKQAGFRMGGRGGVD